jgi:hypothetical protein
MAHRRLLVYGNKIYFMIKDFHRRFSLTRFSKRIIFAIVMKRYLSQREVDRCEQAKEPACKCRCGGKKHGAKRVAAGGDYSTLPMDDPHYRPPMTKKEAIKILRHAETHVICSDLYQYDQAYRETRNILYNATLELVNGVKPL